MRDPIRYEALPVAVRQREAQEARDRSRHALDEVVAQGAEVTEVTQSLRVMRERNQYGQRMALAQRRRLA